MVTRSKLVNCFNLVVVCCFIFLCSSAVTFADQSTAPEKSTEVTDSVKININTATADLLITLPGVGDSIAERIIKHRTEVGEFKSVSELLAIKGIGEKKFEKIAGSIVVK